MEGGGRGSMSPGAAPVKEEPGCADADWVQVAVKVEAESTDEEEYMKAEPSDSEAAGLYTHHVIKVELVLGPECVQRPLIADVHYGERFDSEGTSQKRRGEQASLRECSVRLERVPHCGAPPARARGSNRADTAASARGDSDSEHDTYTTVDYDKDPICDLCGWRFALKSELMEHVAVHIHAPSAEQEEDSGVTDTEEEIDVVSLDDTPQLLQLLMAAAHARKTRPIPQKRRHIVSARSPRPAARKRWVPPAVTAAAPRRRGRRSNTDTDSETEAPQTDRRSMHKDMERFRRFRLRNLFDNLRKQIPATRDKVGAPKIVILREAVSFCRQLKEEECLKKRQAKLLTKLKRLRASIASRHIESLLGF